MLDPVLFSEGFCIRSFELEPAFKTIVNERNWDAVDRAFQELTFKGGRFFNFLEQFHQFSRIEFIISIRDSQNEWEEDGIWHDDGTRVFAFSLSITPHAKELRGGVLEIRKKGEDASLQSIPTPTFGSVILFLTGIHGFEHRTRSVQNGERIVIAGWCYE
jgi:hypothetical protein